MYEFGRDLLSIQRRAEAAHGERHGEQHQTQQRQRVAMKIIRIGSLQHDAAHDADVVREGQELAERLRPAGHPCERET